MPALVLQIDDPQLASHWAMHPEIDPRRVVCRWASASVELLNHALRGIPEERVRYHTLLQHQPWGRGSHDMGIEAHCRPSWLGVRAGAYSFEGRQSAARSTSGGVWETVDLPEGKALIPGHCHPTLPIWSSIPKTVAQRNCSLCRRPSAGEKRRIAGADCGFASLFDVPAKSIPTVRLGQIGGNWRKVHGLRRQELWGPGSAKERRPSNERPCRPVMRCAPMQCRQSGGHEVSAGSAGAPLVF